MADTLLKVVQESVNQLAEIISYIMMADVEIVDDGLQCIAKYYVNEQIHAGQESISMIFSDVLEKGSYTIIDNPRRHDICGKCGDRLRCLKKLEVCFPVRFKGNTIGAVGISCHNLNRKETIVRDFENYETFINMMINLVLNGIWDHADKADSLALYNLMEGAIDHTGKGYIILDGNNRLRKYNDIAQALLELPEGAKNSIIEVIDQNDDVLDSHSYKVTVHNGTYTVLGREVTANVDYSEYRKILIFELFQQPNMPVFQIYTETEAFPIDRIIGVSESIQKVRSKISKMALTNSTVMIYGEKGTGKELAARCIHYESSRRNYPFVVIDCKAVSTDLLENELFGPKDKKVGNFPGKLHLADKGIIFLNNVECLPCHMQEKLIDLLLERSSADLKEYNGLPDVRFILCSNNDYFLEFEDPALKLFTQLTVMPLRIPPLRERSNDLALLFNHFCEKYIKMYNKLMPEVDREFIQKLCLYAWPGNVREMETSIQHWAYATKDGYMPDLAVFFDTFIGAQVPSDHVESYEYIPTLREVEEKYIDMAIRKYGNTTEGKKLAAKALGIGIATLYRKLNEMEMK